MMPPSDRCRVRTSATTLLLSLALWLSPAASWAGTELLDQMPAPIAAPAFDLATPAGDKVNLEQLRGRVVVVNFWASWCPPCRAEMPSLERAFRALRADGVAFVGINVEEDRETVAAFARSEALSFPLVLDPNALVSQAWPMRGLPTTFVVDPAGRIRLRALGEREWDHPEVLAQIRAMAVEAPPDSPTTAAVSD